MFILQWTFAKQKELWYDKPSYSLVYTHYELCSLYSQCYTHWGPLRKTWHYFCNYTIYLWKQKKIQIIFTQQIIEFLWIWNLRNHRIHLYKRCLDRLNAVSQFWSMKGYSLPWQILWFSFAQNYKWWWSYFL